MTCSISPMLKPERLALVLLTGLITFSASELSGQTGQTGPAAPKVCIYSPDQSAKCLGPQCCKNSAASARRQRLRLEDKSFDQWRQAFLADVESEKRLDNLKKLTVFTRHGLADEVAEAILEVISEFDDVYIEYVIKRWQDPRLKADEALREVTKQAREAVPVPRPTDPSAPSIEINISTPRVNMALPQHDFVPSVRKMPPPQAQPVPSPEDVLAPPPPDAEQPAPSSPQVRPAPPAPAHVYSAPRSSQTPEGIEVYDECLDVLIKKMGRTAVPALRKALKSESPAVRWVAFYGLGNLGDKARAALPDLIELAQSKNVSTRAWALFTAGAVGEKDPRVLEVLLAALKDDNKEIRLAVLALFSEIDMPERAKPAIIKCLSDADDDVCRAAIEVLSMSLFDAQDLEAELAAAFTLPNIFKWIQGDEQSLKQDLLRTLQKVSPNAADQDAVAADIVKLIQRDNKDLKQIVYGYLQLLGPNARDAVPALVAQLKSVSSKKSTVEKPLAKWIAVGETPELPDELLPSTYYESLRKTSQEKAPHELIQIVDTLGAVGPDARAAIPVLKNLLESVNAPSSIPAEADGLEQHIHDALSHIDAKKANP